MSQLPGETRRTQYLLTNLIILTIVILALVLLIAAYPILFAPPPTATPTITHTPRPTNTPTPVPSDTLIPTQTRTPRPTFTLQPSLTPTGTSTPGVTPTIITPGPPTITPFKPQIDMEMYTLNSWTPEQADRLVKLMEGYPDTLPAQAGGANNPAYFQSYSYAVYALKEALLRFPDVPQAVQWRWSLAYDLARTGDHAAAQAYAGLVATALNQGDTSIDGLPDWFHNQEARMSLHIFEVKPPQGMTGSHVVQLRGGGSAFLWILETPGSYQVSVVDDEFDFTRPLDADSIISDLTSDGIEDLAIYYTSLPTTTLRLETPKVFDLSQAPAQKLPFSAAGANFNIGASYTNYWAVQTNSAGQNDLVFRSIVFTACPTQLERVYHWNGETFALVSSSYDVRPSSLTLPFCRLLAEHAMQDWGAEAAAQIMQKILPLWPPQKDENGELYPLDAKDEWRYRIGVAQALAGQFDGAVRTLQSLIVKPTLPASRWILPAQAFLQAYKKPDEVYIACTGVEICNPTQAIRYLVSEVSPQDFPNVIQILQSKGLNLVASGYFDFDKDGTEERWFTVRNRPLEKPQMWVLALAPKSVQPFLVGSLDTNKPDLGYLDPDAEPPVVTVETGLAFSLTRDPVSREASLLPVSVKMVIRNRYLEGLQAAEDTLFSGGNPAAVVQDLLNLATYPGLLCKPYWSCDPYYYSLGLAYELMGDANNARDRYHRLWLDYSKSPFTVMARLKLIERKNTPTPGAPVAASATPIRGVITPLPQSTLTPTSTPGAATATPAPGTPLPTSTPGTPTATTQSSRPTATPLSYPAPATPTPYPAP